MARWFEMLGLVGALSWGTAVVAEPIVLEGLTFSDELGGLVLQQGWGSGSLEDPFVLVEKITGQGPAILVVRNLRHAFGNRIRSHHDVGFALTKIIENATGQPWSLFNLELREYLDRPSPFGDGLSFGQASDVGRPFSSDRFTDSIETREPYDGIQFFNGVVQPGERVTVSFVITDTTPQWQFFLLQKRDAPVAGDPAPSLGQGVVDAGEAEPVLAGIIGQPQAAISGAASPGR